MTRSTRLHVMSTLLATAVFAAACADGASTTKGPPDVAETDPATTDADAVAADPQEVNFAAADGQPLMGLYYPAATTPAPVIVLLHWAGGDKSDWYEIAPWLQNRGLANPFPNPGDEPWWDPSWFPIMPDDLSVGVFIASFRGCEPFPSGCQTFDPEGWLLDAQAALGQAGMLPGADSARIVAIGSSIGADGAVDACFWSNEQAPGSCDGALSLSPGSFLGFPYVTAIENLGGANPIPAWCLANASEFPICVDAESAGNTAFSAIEIGNAGHGNELIVPAAQPSTLQTVIDFLLLTVPG